MKITHSSASRPATGLLVAITLLLGMGGGAVTTGAAPAQAVVSAAKANTAVAYARSKNGAPYQYGSAGPRRFDCSGLTMWSYASAGKRLPRTADQHYHTTIRVARTSRRPGDLVFFLRRGVATHVGVYAGAGRYWHSPQTGDHVRLAIIRTTVVYGRVR